MAKRPAFLALVVCVALMARILFLWHVHPTPVSDFHWYYRHGIALAQGRGYRYLGQPTAYFPIGYPLFLSGIFKVFGVGWWPAVLANVALNSVTAGLVYLIAEFLWRPVPALISGLAMALYVPHIQWSSVICSEIIFSLLFLLTGYLWIRSEKKSWGLLVASGFVLGLASMVRPITLLFPITYFVYAMIRNFGFRASLCRGFVITMVMLLTISPVTLRNYVAFHRLLLVSANGGVNLWQGNNPNANGSYFWPDNPRENPFLDYKAHAVDENSMAAHRAISYIVHHPLHTAKMGFVKWRHLFAGVGNVQFYTTRISVPPVSATLARLWAVLAEGSYVITYVLGCIGIAFDVRDAVQQRSGRSSAMWLGMLYYLGLFFIFPAWSRMRAPLLPWVAVFVGWGVWNAIDRVRALRRNGYGPFIPNNWGVRTRACAGNRETGRSTKPDSDGLSASDDRRQPDWTPSGKRTKLFRRP